MGAVFALYSAWYFWIPKILGVDYNKSLSKTHFWILFTGVNVTFFPQHFLGLQGMPRRISDYADAFAGWNMVSSLGSLISVVATWLFLHILYVQLVEGKATSRYLWLTPQFYFDILQTLLSRVFNSLEWGLISPPKPHAFVSLPLQSRPDKKNTQQDRINAKHWEERVKDYPALAERARVFRDKNLNQDYIDVDEYLSNHQVDESEKHQVLDDQFSTLKAKYITDLTTLDLDRSSTQEDRDNLKQKFDHERESMVRSARDNKVSLDRVDIGDSIDPDNWNKSTRSAVELKQTEKTWRFINQVFDGDVEAYAKFVDEIIIPNDPSLDRSSFIDEAIQEELDDKNTQIKKEDNRERDEYLALQQQSEPFDPFDPDV